MCSRSALSILALLLAGCATVATSTPHCLRVSYVTNPINADGNLDEACYREHAPLTAFAAAGDRSRPCAPTKAWLFWNEAGLSCAFSCVDSTPVYAPPNANERSVDNQDRCELFLWSGEPKDTYYCIEIAPGNAVHDYSARFYRKFDDAWSPGQGTVCRATLRQEGYSVEVFVPRAVMEAMGFKLEATQKFRAGLFRADFTKASGQPTWIAWVDRGHPPADFHVAESFGVIALSDK